MVGKKATTSKKPARKRKPLAPPKPAEPAAPPKPKHRDEPERPEKPAPVLSREETRLREAQRALGGFWGATQSDGSAQAWATCRQQLLGMKLSQKELRRLRRRLPKPAGGTTLLRVQQLETLLEELEEEAA